MKKVKLGEQKWFPYTVASCAAVVLYVVLSNLGNIGAGLKTFTGYFAAIALGGVLAYIMNPLAMLYNNRVLKAIRSPGLRWTLSIALTLVTVLLLLGFLLGTLIPQMYYSVSGLLDNMDGYIASLRRLTDQWGVSEALNLDKVLDSSTTVVMRITNWVKENIGNIINASATAGKGVANWVLAIILSVYLLASKEGVKKGAKRLLHAIVGQKRLDAISTFAARCDKIVTRYIVFSLLDAAIVGCTNAVFMFVAGMQYVGLVSMVVAVTNLVPTFGPVIGAVIGGFVLLLVNPVHALIFVIFTVILQFLDGYVIKPKLFGNSLGVSGLLILAAVVVFGNMFGIVGILLSIPLAAILDFIYSDYFLPTLERRQEKNEARKDAE